jgi:hypothetical protein
MKYLNNIPSSVCSFVYKTIINLAYRHMYFSLFLISVFSSVSIILLTICTSYVDVLILEDQRLTPITLYYLYSLFFIVLPTIIISSTFWVFFWSNHKQNHFYGIPLLNLCFCFILTSFIRFLISTFLFLFYYSMLSNFFHFIMLIFGFMSLVV